MNTPRQPNAQLSRIPAGFAERVAARDTRIALDEYVALAAAVGQARVKLAELERGSRAVASDQRALEVAAVRKDPGAVPKIDLIEKHQEKIRQATELRSIREGARAGAQRDLIALLERDEAAHAASVDATLAEETDAIRADLERLDARFTRLEELRTLRSWVADPYGRGRAPALVVPNSHGSRMRGGQAPGHAISMLARSLEPGPVEVEEEPAAAEPAEAKPPAPRHRTFIPVGIV